MENTVTDQILEETLPQTEAPETQDQSTNVDNPQSELERLIEIRTGLFDVNLELEDLKWLKNTCNSKFSFKGPNDAFMLINAYLGLDGAIQNIGAQKDVKTVKLTAATVEALAVLVNRYEGTGVGPAQKVFKVAISLQQAISIMRELDSQINALETAMNAQTSGEPESAE